MLFEIKVLGDGTDGPHLPGFSKAEDGSPEQYGS